MSINKNTPIANIPIVENIKNLFLFIDLHHHPII